jgi:hypothetical protein
MRALRNSACVKFNRAPICGSPVRRTELCNLHPNKRTGCCVTTVGLALPHFWPPHQPHGGLVALLTSEASLSYSSLQSDCFIVVMSSPAKLRKALQQSRDGDQLEDTIENDSNLGGRESPLDDRTASSSLPIALSEERIKSILLGIVPCSNSDLGAAYKSTMKKLGMQQDGVALHEFEPKELCAMLRSSNHGMRAVACNIVKEMCQKVHGGSISARAAIQESLSNGLLLLLYTCAAQACKAVDAKMEVGEDGMSEPAAPIKDAQSICEAIGAVSTFDIFEQDTKWLMPDPTKLCRLASAACSLWRSCHFISSERKPIFVSTIMDMATTLTDAMIFFETHPKNAVAMAWEHRNEIYQIELSDKQFIRSLLMVISAKPRTKYAYIASRVIRNGTNVAEFCNR